MPSYHDAETPEDIPGGIPAEVKSGDEIREEEITETVVELLNRAVTIEQRGSALKMTVCHMCGCYEGAHIDCPVPALEGWLEARS